MFFGMTNEPKFDDDQWNIKFLIQIFFSLGDSSATKARRLQEFICFLKLLFIIRKFNG